DSARPLRRGRPEDARGRSGPVLDQGRCAPVPRWSSPGPPLDRTTRCSGRKGGRMAPETPTGRELEAETLLWIARLPLLRLEALSALTGASAEEVRRAVDALRRHGWVERL